MDFKSRDGTIVSPGAKIISLNTQAANLHNFWIIGEREDIGGQMSWFEA
jgi:hypothetical protein